MYDILCYGALCADNLIRLPRLPAPGEGVRALSDSLVPGGNALNEARCLAAWDRSVALLGDALGDDPEGALLRRAVAAAPGIDGSHLLLVPGARTPLCRIMITPDGQRTIMAVRSADHPNTPLTPALLDAARVVSVTRFGAGVVAAAEAARTAGKLLVIGDGLLLNEPFAALADVIVGSVAYLRGSGEDLETQLRRLHALRGAAVIVTDGPDPIYALIDGELLTLRTHTLDAVDTTGAGDCFRAGISYGLSQDWSWPQTLHWANAAAAAWCLTDSNEPPSLADVSRFFD